MPSHFIAAPFAFWFLAALYRAWRMDGEGAIWMAAPFLALAIIFILAPQINWWWWKRNTPDLPEGLADLLEKQCPFYQKLTTNEKADFRGRVFMSMHGYDFLGKAFPKDAVPVDLKAIIAANAVTVSWPRKEFLFRKFEKIVVYPQAFPTPRFQSLHGSEMQAEEGLVIFSGELLIKSFLQPLLYFNVGLYEFARAAMKSWPDEPWPEFAEADWLGFQQVMPFSKGLVEAQIGLPGVDLTAVAAHHFFQNREGMRAVFPQQTADFEKIFG